MQDIGEQGSLLTGVLGVQLSEPSPGEYPSDPEVPALKFEQAAKHRFKVAPETRRQLERTSKARVRIKALKR